MSLLVVLQWWLVDVGIVSVGCSEVDGLVVKNGGMVEWQWSSLMMLGWSRKLEEVRLVVVNGFGKLHCVFFVSSPLMLEIDLLASIVKLQ